jgi:hypothetical protein
MEVTHVAIACGLLMTLCVVLIVLVFTLFNRILEIEKLSDRREVRRDNLSGDMERIAGAVTSLAKELGYEHSSVYANNQKWFKIKKGK